MQLVVSSFLVAFSLEDSRKRGWKSDSFIYYSGSLRCHRGHQSRGSVLAERLAFVD